MRVIHQLAKIVERAEMLVHAVEVDRAIAVVIGDRLIAVLLARVQVVDVVVIGVNQMAVTPRSFR